MKLSERFLEKRQFNKFLTLQETKDYGEICSLEMLEQVLNAERELHIDLLKKSDGTLIKVHEQLDKFKEQINNTL